MPRRTRLQVRLSGGRFSACFYGSLLVLLWGEIEAVIESFAAEIRSIKSVSLAFNDIRGRNAFEGGLDAVVQAPNAVVQAPNVAAVNRIHADAPVPAPLVDKIDASVQPDA